MILEKISGEDLNGFTKPLKGWLYRYIVWLTHNVFPSESQLQKQYDVFWSLFTTITIGGWRDPEGVLYIDIGTSTDSLKEALMIGKVFKQQCIWDNDTCKEVTV
jgi:hypothetical protein